MATLESTAFLALGFGAVNGQDFPTRRDPLGRFTLFLISQLVSGSRVSLTQGRAGPATKKWGTAKVARFTVPKNFLGAAKIARFNLYCATKLLGTAKVARFTVPKIFLGAAKIARFSLYCATKLLGTAKVARFTVPKNFLGAAKIADSAFTVRQSFWEQQR